MKKARAAFTVLELAIVIGIISILVVLILPALAGMRSRAQRLQCMGNLRSLHIGAEQYLQDNNQWPQIRINQSSDSIGVVYAQKWIAALKPYGILQKTWICPTVENFLNNPDYASAGSERIDYFGMPFDDKPLTPHQWPRQPWFVESANAHGNGQLIIFTDGSIVESHTLIPTGSPSKLASP